MTAGPDHDDRGVYRRYLDADDHEVPIGPTVVQALRELVGTPPDDHEDTTPIVLRQGDRRALGRGDVALECGGARAVDGALPADLPLGYHRWQPAQGPERDLIVSPGRCHLSPGLRDWGFAVQLYAARSRASWGIGDLADLGTVRDWATGLGARFLMVNPLHAAAPTMPQEASPYSPTTRRFASPLYLRPELVPGAERADVSMPPGANDATRIDRDAVWPAKRAALRAVFDVRTGSDGFERWRAGQGRSLEEFATWCALAERQGPSWREWPSGLRHPSSPDVAAFANAAPADVSFHAWMQWALATQLADAAARITVIQDLPIGFAPGGADAWAWQDLLALDVTVGAPPDLLNGQGQDWGLPPFVPWRLRAAGYAPFIESIRATIAGAGGLRIDHVMGLFRLWWIPPGEASGGGGYVRYPSADLLDILALESD
nr:4-alpha-glucanotransferase [Geodermatophilaceae bacterium]